MTCVSSTTMQGNESASRAPDERKKRHNRRAKHPDRQCFKRSKIRGRPLGRPEILKSVKFVTKWVIDRGVSAFDFPQVQCRPKLTVARTKVVNQSRGMIRKAACEHSLATKKRNMEWVPAGFFVYPTYSRLVACSQVKGVGVHTIYN